MFKDLCKHILFSLHLNSIYPVPMTFKNKIFYIDGIFLLSLQGISNINHIFKHKFLKENAKQIPLIKHKNLDNQLLWHKATKDSKNNCTRITTKKQI